MKILRLSPAPPPSELALPIAPWPCPREVDVEPLPEVVVLLCHVRQGPASVPVVVA